MKRLAAIVLAAVALPACGEAPAGKPTGTTTGKPFAQRIDGVKGIENFARVNPGLYRGAQPTDDGYRQLKSMGVKTVVCLRQHHSYAKDAEAAGLRSVEIPVHADVFGSTPPSDDDLKKFFAAILDPASQPVYFHCAHGKDRTGTLGAVCRIELDGWTPDEAIEEMQSFGYHDVYKDLVAYVRAYRARGFAKKP